VTEARVSRSADIAYRERRYLIMMSIRLVCFVIAVVLFINGAGWLTAIPAVGAIIIPYFAVIFANGGREPNTSRGFQAYEPNLPDRFSPASSAADRDRPRESRPAGSDPAGSDPAGPGRGGSAPGESGTPGNLGESGQAS
jgi:hypothetical protein